MHSRENIVPSDDDPRLSVLVVDDDEAIRKLLRRWLEQWKFSVRTAGSAADALALMIAHQSAIVVCDLRMPGHDGVWLMQQIKRAWPQTVLVVTSGVSDPDVVEQVRALGAVDFVTKPVGSESLRQAMDRAERASGQTDR